MAIDEWYAPEIGDLVRDVFDHSWEQWNGCENLKGRIGIVTSFDVDNDPIVLWCIADDSGDPSEACFVDQLEFVNGSR